LISQYKYYEYDRKSQERPTYAQDHPGPTGKQCPYHKGYLEANKTKPYASEQHRKQEKTE